MRRVQVRNCFPFEPQQGQATLWTPHPPVGSYRPRDGIAAAASCREADRGFRQAPMLFSLLGLSGVEGQDRRDKITRGEGATAARRSPARRRRARAAAFGCPPWLVLFPPALPLLTNKMCPGSQARNGEPHGSGFMQPA